MSSARSPFASEAEVISATLLTVPWKLCSTTKEISTDSLAPGAKGPAILKLVAPVGVKPAGVKSSIWIFVAAIVP